jgi:prepilin-type N-terminal cleavage/methylation domain-containing protein
MIRRVNKGLTIIEVLIVLAVSTSLAVISIGAFSSRGRTQDDDAARQVLADIALVRNQAQQGQGPTTAATTALTSGSELFGQAIIFTQDATNMEVKKLAKSSSGIYVYESYTVNNPSSLAWNVSKGSDNTLSTATCSTTTQFLACFDGVPFKNSTNPIINKINNITTPVIKLILVFKNGSGESYALTDNADNASLSTYTKDINYNSAQQKILRVGLAKQGSTLPDSTKSPQYYINFDLAIPNNQELQVFK